MDRQQAMSILWELVGNDLVDPSYVHICERTPNNYQIQIKTKYNRNQLDAYALKNNLMIEEDKAERYLVIISHNFFGFTLFYPKHSGELHLHFLLHQPVTSNRLYPPIS